MVFDVFKRDLIFRRARRIWASHFFNEDDFLQSMMHPRDGGEQVVIIKIALASLQREQKQI
jgi:hypothetical protein